MCIIQFSRFCSVRETAGILALGVRFFTPLHTYGRIAKIPADQLETLLNLPYVIWIGPYLPSYKYNTNQNFDFDWGFMVKAFIEDEDVIRTDLNAIGVAISVQRGRYVSVKLTPESLATLARVWWVESIHQSPRVSPDRDSGAQRTRTGICLLCAMILFDERPAHNQEQLEDTAETHTENARFSTRCYYKMNDPRKAAVLMLRDARQKGIDIDAIPSSEFRTGPIRIPYGKINPDENDRSFVETVTANDTASISTEFAMCIIQFERRCSLRELADILSLGISIYCGLPPNAEIAKVPIRQLSTLTELPYIKWVGPYKPSYKHRPGAIYDPDVSFDIVSFIEDGTIMTSDLNAIGVDVKSHYGYNITVRMMPDKVAEVAQLWWVKKIYQAVTRIEDIR
jgi:hypothetical protein